MEAIKTITEDQFYEQFTPQKNHLDDNASFDECMFETYGEEMEYVIKMSKKNQVVTILECDGEETDEEGYLIPLMYYASGLHLVNRLGFLIVDKPIKEEFEVLID